MKKTKKTDLRRKVTPLMAYRMKLMVKAGKKSVDEIATHFGVTPYAVRYNTNEEFRKTEIKRVSVCHSKVK